MSISDQLRQNVISSLPDTEVSADKSMPVRQASSFDVVTAKSNSKEGSFFEQLAQACQRRPPDEGWTADHSADDSNTWLLVHSNQTEIPDQGWKLHVSANINSVADVLSRALPVLFEERVTFKIASSTRNLALLNEGALGSTQIGKFLTVYPHDDKQAVRVAYALNSATEGLQGPVISSDQRLTPNSIVYYRYGGFRKQYIQDQIGIVHLAIKSPEGDWVADNRKADQSQPERITDPFITDNIAAAASTISTSAASPELLIAKRYLLVSLLHHTIGNDIYMAIDLQSKRTCVLKRAKRESAIDFDGLDAMDRLRNEANNLARLAPDPRFPMPLDVIAQEDELLLVMNDMGSQTLEAYIAALNGQGLTLDNSQIKKWGIQLASILRAIHSKNIVHGDIKSSNIIVSTDGNLGLLDFELSSEIGTEKGSGGRGTTGYISPQQASGSALCPADDIYSLGAILYFLATKAEPSQSPQPFDLLRRGVACINPEVDPALVRVIERCCAADKEARYASAVAVEEALTQVVISNEARSISIARFANFSVDEVEEQKSRFRKLATSVGDTLVAVAKELPDNQGIIWETSHPLGAGRYSRDINIGSSGTVLALAELVSELKNDTHRQTLARAAKGLQHIPPMQSDPLPGLYVGEGGIAAASLRAGHVLSDASLIHYAEDKSRWIAAQPYGSPDLFHGTAGRLRLHLLVWQSTKDNNHLKAAITAGEQLLNSSEQFGSDQVCWRIPDGYGPQSGLAFLGYSHGAAGIADVLLDLFEATGDERFLESARGAARWLASKAESALDDQTGLAWPAAEDTSLTHPYWCHGSAGIAKFFLHAAQLGVTEEAQDIANGAVEMATWGVRYSGPTQCHGLAGNIELLLDFYQATGDPHYLADAYLLADLLTAFVTRVEGNLVLSSESRSIFTPDYMVGYAGVAMCLLRLANPSLLPHQLSMAGFRAHDLCLVGAS